MHIYTYIYIYICNCYRSAYLWAILYNYTDLHIFVLPKAKWLLLKEVEKQENKTEVVKIGKTGDKKKRPVFKHDIYELKKYIN